MFSFFAVFAFLCFCVGVYTFFLYFVLVYVFAYFVLAGVPSVLGGFGRFTFHAVGLRRGWFWGRVVRVVAWCGRLGVGVVVAVMFESCLGGGVLEGFGSLVEAFEWVDGFEFLTGGRAEVLDDGGVVYVAN